MYINFVDFSSAYCGTNQVPRPSTCLDTLTLHSACTDKVPRPIAMTCVGLVPRPRTCLDTVPRPSAMSSKGASA